MADTNKTDDGLYNSRIVKNYLEYIKKYHGDVAIDPILSYAGITPYEVEDQGHWFTQTQVDRFHEILEQKTGDLDISRKVGRYAASSESLGPGKQYTLGLMSPTSAYLLMNKLYAIMSLAVTINVKKLGRNSVEILSTPRPGVKEKPHQCENRIGTFEAVATFFTKKFARVEQPSCIHRGDEYCRYIVSWESTPSLIWRRLGKLALLLSIPACVALFFVLPAMAWLVSLSGCCLITAIIFLKAWHLSIKELTETIETQGDVAKDLLDEMNIRYNNAMLIKEIGQATSTILDVDELMKAVVSIMEKRLDFDRGLVMLANEEKSRLIYTAGYGYQTEQERLLETTEFHLNKPESKGLFVRIYKDQKPFLIDDISKIKESLSERSQEFARVMGVKSLVCVPIVYENQSLGILSGDNISSKRQLTQSDMSLLMGVASQTAVSIVNAISFQKLQDSEEKYRSVLESVEEGLFETNLDGNLQFFNDSFCTIYGRSRDELMGMKGQDLHTSETKDRVNETFKEIYLNDKLSKPLESKIFRKNNEIRDIEMSVGLIYDGSTGKRTGFRGVIRDITEKKRAEALRHAKIAAETASRAKSKFLATVSHEVRTPLNAIIGMTELALDSGLDDDQRNILNVIRAESDSLLRILNDILDFSKIDAGMMELDDTRFDLRIMIDDLCSIVAQRAQRKGLEFFSYLSPDIPSQLIGDPGRLRQILINLADNAIKFTSEGEIYFKGEEIEDLGDKLKIHFSVKDSGIGIPKAKQAEIFQSFTQADGSITRKYGGTGLGTTISKELAELMGGEIGVDSEEGKGSTFWFTVVLSKQKEQQPAQAGQYIDLSGLKVLIVDNNQRSRFILMEYLRSWGCSPVEALSAEEALSILSESVESKDPFGLILSEIIMPEMGGFDLAMKIKNIEDFRQIPIIAIASIGRRGDSKRCKDTGIHGYLTKPIKWGELHKAVLSVLQVSTEEDTEAAQKLVTRHTIAEEYKAQILLADDYPTNQQVVMRHLCGAGYDVDLVDNGQQAVDAFTRKPYDLILMDLEMPVMDGYEAARLIRELELRSKIPGPDIVRNETGKFLSNPAGASQDPESGNRHVPIIAMTAHTTNEYTTRCLDMGMDDYVIKPLTKKELLTIVDKWINSVARPGPGTSDPQPAITTHQGAWVGDQGSGGDVPINFERAIREFDGDKEFLMEVLGGFLENVTAQIEIIRDAISAGNAEIVRKEAHSIKGGGSNLTANALSRVALELENIGKSGQLERGLEALKRLEKEANQLEAYSRDR